MQLTGFSADFSGAFKVQCWYQVACFNNTAYSAIIQSNEFNPLQL